MPTAKELLKQVQNNQTTTRTTLSGSAPPPKENFAERLQDPFAWLKALREKPEQVSQEELNKRLATDIRLREAQRVSQPFTEGITQRLSLGTMEKTTKEQIEKLTGQPELYRGEEITSTLPYKAGELTGRLAQVALGRTALGGGVSKLVAPLTAGKTAIGKMLIDETALDVIVDLPIDLTEGYNKGLRGLDLAKHVGQGALINLVANIGLGGRELAKATSREISEAILKVSEKTSLPESVLKSAANTVLGKKGAKEFLETTTKEVAEDIVPKTVPKTVKKGIDDILGKINKPAKIKEYGSQLDTLSKQIDEIKSRPTPSAALRQQPKFVQGQFVDYNGKQYEIAEVLEDSYKAFDEYGRQINIPISQPLKEVDIEKSIKELESLLSKETLTIADKFRIEEALSVLDEKPIIEKMPQGTVSTLKKLNQAYDKIADVEAKYRARITDTEELRKAKEQFRNLKNKQKVLEKAFDNELFSELKKSAKNTYTDANQNKINELISGIDLKAKSMSPKTEIKLKGMLQYKEAMEESGQSYNKEVFEKVNRLDQKRLSDMTLEEKEDLMRAITTINHLEKTKNTIRLGQQIRKVNEVKRSLLNNLNTSTDYVTKQGFDKKVFEFKDKINNIARSDDNSSTLFLRMAEGDTNHPIYKIYEGMRDGYSKYADFKYNASLAGENLNKVKDNFLDLKLSNGSRTLNTPQRMYVYLLNKSEDGRKALGKIHVADDDVLGLKLNEQDIDTIISTLSAQEIKAADDIFTWFNTAAKDKANETSMLLDGIKIARYDNYTPILRFGKGGKSAWNSFKNAPNLSNAGFLKQRTDEGEGILLTGLDDLFKTYSDSIAKYVGYEPTIRDAEKVFNSTEVKRALNKTYGSDFSNILRRRFENVKGVGKPESEAAKGISKLIRNIQSSILGANVSVFLKQLPSVITGMAKIDPKYFVNNIKLPSKDIIYKYSPILYDRASSGFTREAAETLNKKFGKTFTANIRLGDNIAMYNLWKAASAEAIESGFKEGTEEFYQQVGKRVSDVVVETQPIFNPFFTPDILKDENPLVRLWVMFSTQRSQNANLIKQGLIKAKYTGDNSELARNVSVVLASSLAISGLQTGLQAYRGQEQTPVKNAISAVASNSILIAPIINKILFGFDVDNVSESAINNFLDSTLSLANPDSKLTPNEKIIKIAQSIATIKGVPLKTFMREAESIYNIITGGQ